jgi:hypothetical protein
VSILRIFLHPILNVVSALKNGKVILGWHLARYISTLPFLVGKPFKAFARVLIMKFRVNIDRSSKAIKDDSNFL